MGKLSEPRVHFAFFFEFGDSEAFVPRKLWPSCAALLATALCVCKAKMPKQNTICGRIAEKVTSNRSHMAQSNLCEKLFGFSPTVLGNQARGTNMMEVGRAENLPTPARVQAHRLFSVLALHEGVPRAMDHHSSGLFTRGEISHVRISLAG